MLVDSEFKDLLPPLSVMELETLRVSIESEGQRDPIIVWANNSDTIIDGHNRYAICQELGIKPKVKALTFADRGEVLKWIYMNQQGRRNITPEQLSYIRGKVYNLRKQSQGGDHKSKGQVGTLIESTAEQVADEFGVSDRTIKRDAKFATEVDKAEPEKKKAMLTRRGKKKTAKKSSRDKKTNGHTDGGWADALEQATKKDFVGKEDIAKFKGITNLPDCRKGLSILSQGSGYLVTCIGTDKYRVQHAVVLPVDDVSKVDANLLATVKREMSELLGYLRDRNAGTASHDICLRYVKKTLKALDHVSCG